MWLLLGDRHGAAASTAHGKCGAREPETRASMSLRAISWTRLTPDGPGRVLTPGLLQALFFRLFGVNWFAYCVHAALTNALFCLLVYRFLRLLGGGRGPALVYAALSGVVMYPPFGVPYYDQHAFVFTFLGI